MLEKYFDLYARVRIFWEFFGNGLGISWEFFWNFLGILMIFLGMCGRGVLIWDFFGKFLRIILEFFWNLKLHTDTKL